MVPGRQPGHHPEHWPQGGGEVGGVAGGWTSTWGLSHSAPAADVATSSNTPSVEAIPGGGEPTFAAPTTCVPMKRGERTRPLPPLPRKRRQAPSSEKALVRFGEPTSTSLKPSPLT